MVELCPLQYFLTRIWEQISTRDTNSIFKEPVDIVEVPDYSEVGVFCRKKLLQRGVNRAIFFSTCFPLILIF